MRIIIFYEHLLREWKAVMRLKNELEKSNYEVKVYSIIFERTKAFVWAKRRGIDVVLVPWFVDEAHEEILSPFIGLNKYLKIVNLHHEEVSSAAFEAVLYPKTECSKNGCYHLVWGEYFKERLIQHGVEESKIYVTGNIRNDEVSRTACAKEQLAKEFNLDMHKKWILFAENRGWLLQRNSDAAKTELKRRGLSSEQIEQSINYTKESMDAFWEEVHNLSEVFNEEFEFIYRPHPGTHFTVDENMPKSFHLISAYSIYDWIKNCDLFLTCESTSSFEAEMCGKPVAIFDLVEEPSYLKMVGVHDYPRIESLNDITSEYIESLYKAHNREETIYSRYLGIVDGNATKRVVAAIEDINTKDTLLSEVEYKKISMLFGIRQMIYEEVTYLMDRLGLLDKMKFPKSAYVERGDIPYSKKNCWIRDIK